MSFFKSAMHTVKKTVSSVTGSSASSPVSDDDPAYTLAKTQFDRYHESLLSLKTHISQYQVHSYGLLTAMHLNSVDIASISASDDDGHTPGTSGLSGIDYRNMMVSMRNAHSDLVGDMEASHSRYISTQCMGPLQDQISADSDLHARIEERNKIRTELKYYSQKMESLEAEKSKKAHKQTVSDRERYDRNVTKLNELTTTFSQKTTQLTSDLNAVYNARFSLIGPITAHLLQGETSIVRMMDTAINSVQSPVVPSNALVKSNSMKNSPIADKNNRRQSLSKENPTGNILEYEGAQEYRQRNQNVFESTENDDGNPFA